MQAPAGLVLASASPRRRELLQRLGWQFEVRPADVDETPIAGEDPVAYVRRLAEAKAVAVFADTPDAVVLAADTVVDLDGALLGKPADTGSARSMLRRLSGRTHRVHTGVAVASSSRCRVGSDTTFVTMAPLGTSVIEWYVGTGEPLDKAGAYAIQGAGAMFVERVRGSTSNVVGLPLAVVARLLAPTLSVPERPRSG